MSSLDDVKRRYDFSAWAGRNRLPVDLHVRGLFIPRDRLVPPGAVGVATLATSRRQAVGRQAFSSIWKVSGVAGLPASLRCDVVEHVDRDQAHEVVAAVLANFESPLVSSGATNEVGDIAFSVPGNRAIVFARANVTVLLANVSDAPIDVTAVAMSIDDWISATHPAGSVLTSTPAATAPTLDVQSPAPGGAVRRLALQVPPTLETHGPAMVKLFARRGAVYGTASGLRLRPDATTPSVDGYVYERTPDGAGRCVRMRRR